MFRRIESVVLFVADIRKAASWYADLLDAPVDFENDRFAFVHSHGITLGFHPADEKCPGGIGGTTVYWEVSELESAISVLIARGATVYRGPGATDFGARVALMLDPFGCTIGLNESTPESRRRISSGVAK
jgi:predicted enzyme related to lactoylglutathione lyase